MEVVMSTNQQQKLQITPQLRQAISILQMSSLELNEYINEQLWDNPFTDWAPKDPRVNTKNHARTANQSTDEEADWWLNQIPDDEVTLETVLRQQLNYIEMETRQHQLCLYLIRSLNGHGYLDLPLEWLTDQVNCSISEVNAALKIVQSLEPAGVGATTLQECLILQLDRLGLQDELVRSLISFELEQIAGKKIQKLAKKYAVSVCYIQQAIDQICRLNPKPGAVYGKSHSNYIYPDIIIENRKGRYLVIIEDKTAPTISWNPLYLQMMKQKRLREDSDFLRQKWSAAKSISTCIEQRKVTLKKVMEAIVEVQHSFFEYGVAYLKPLTMQQIADIIKMHESTVSRAVHDKYVQTPWGIIQLKQFFSAGIGQADGQSTSASEIRERVHNIIKQENKVDPLSDQKIADQLKAEGLDIARRTVTKYREQLNILSTTKRRQYG